MKIAFTRISGNSKTGPIPTTLTEKNSCPDVCPLKGSGCYAEIGHTNIHWVRVSNGDAAKYSWSNAMAQIQALPKDQLWRHNVSGDLPQSNGLIDYKLVGQLIDANKGKRGFTYTHHDVSDSDNGNWNKAIIAGCNAQGFTVNLSGNSLEHADELKALDIGPVVTICPEGTEKQFKTPAGNTVVICPATYRDDIQCVNCGLCAVSTRKSIVGFPVHGIAKKKAHKVFMMHSANSGE